MYIEPNTNVYILRNCPLDVTYHNTIYFANRTAQTTYFSSLSKYTLTRNYYQRVNKGRMKVQIKAENLYDCNYMMFQNESFGSKWFYAFITSVNYVSNDVSEINYTVDVMQTWFFDYTLQQCFVEREHSATDHLFEHLLDEGLDLGSDMVVNAHNYNFATSMSTCILATKTPDGDKPVPKLFNSVMMPLHIYTCNMDKTPATNGIPDELTEVIDKYIDIGEDHVIAIYQYPTWFGSNASVNLNPANVNWDTFVNLEVLDQYRPRNKKIFSYPFTEVIVTSSDGSSASYKLENWNTVADVGKFMLHGTFATTPNELCSPVNYRNSLVDYPSGLALTQFPTCAFVGDAFKAWFAQKGLGTFMGVDFTTENVGRFAKGGIDLVRGGLEWFTGEGREAERGAQRFGSALEDLGGEVLQSIMNRHELEHTPPQVKGQAQIDSLNAGLGRVGFQAEHVCAKREYLMIADQYFDRYGYLCHEHKTPNRNVRPHWTYTKTVGCTIEGGLPADDAKKIEDIYDNGITFWRVPSEVGNYSLDNTVD